MLPKPGVYVIAVSGGVDSMTLLHILNNQKQKDKNWKLTVAHLDHGIREDSVADRQLVQLASQNYGLPFVFHESHLGAGTGEARARQVRYEFLKSVMQAASAEAIMTAHHRDDVLETAIINLLRGSGRKGLSSLTSRTELVRPLLQVSKSELVTYAKDQGLIWREDSTNEDIVYLRNYVRRRLLSKFDEESKNKLWQIIADMTSVNNQLDELISTKLQDQTFKGGLNRQWFNSLPHQVSKEVLAAWLRSHGCRSFDRKILERLVVAAKVAAPGKVFPILDGLSLRVYDDYLALTV